MHLWYISIFTRMTSTWKQSETSWAMIHYWGLDQKSPDNHLNQNVKIQNFYTWESGGYHMGSSENRGAPDII